MQKYFWGDILNPLSIGVGNALVLEILIQVHIFLFQEIKPFHLVSNQISF